MINEFKIRDVEFAFFSQLSYLNWNNINNKFLQINEYYIHKNFIKFLKSNIVWEKIKHKNTIEPKVENGILMYDEADKRLFGVFGIERDEDREWYRKQIYEFVQFMKETGTFEYVDLDILVVDSRELISTPRKLLENLPKNLSVEEWRK